MLISYFVWYINFFKINFRGFSSPQYSHHWQQGIIVNDLQIKNIGILMWPTNTSPPPLDLPCMRKRLFTTCTEGLCESLITRVGAAATAAMPPPTTNLLNWKLCRNAWDGAFFIISVQHSYSDYIWLLWEGLQFAAMAELHWQLHWRYSNHILTALLEPYFYWLLCYFCTGFLNQLCRHFDCNDVWN